MSELPARSRRAPLPSPSSGWTYVGRAVCHPAATMLLFLGLFLGAWTGGAPGLLFGVIGGLALAASGSRLPACRRLLDEHVEARARRQRDVERERRLQRAGPLRRAEFAELTDLVDEIECSDSAQAERFELQGLLDYFVNLALSHQRLVEVMRRAERAPLWEAGVARMHDDIVEASRQRQDILLRRIHHRDECRTRAARMADELDAVSEFLHLVSEVTSCPVQSDGDQGELERRLWELEVQESALRQLSAA